MIFKKENLENQTRNCLKEPLSRAMILASLTLLAVTFAAFYPSLENGFTNWDDPAYLLDNSKVKSLSLRNVAAIFTDFNVEMYIPLTYVTYAIEHLIYGLNPAGYHLTNLLLHLVNCFLALWLFWRLSGSLTVAFVTSMLFGIHPLHVESVAWVAQRKDVLYALFFLGSLIVYEKGKNLEEQKGYLISLGLFLCALLSKTSAVMLPFVLILIDYFKGRKLTRRVFTEKLPFFVLAAAFGAIGFATQTSAGAVDLKKMWHVGDGMASAMDGYAFYIIRLIVPVHLSAFYPKPAVAGFGLHPNLMIAPLIVFVLLSLFFYFAKESRKLVFGGAFFMILLLPVIQLIPVGQAMAADRYSYLPSLGLFYLAGEALRNLLSHAGEKSQTLKMNVWILFIILIGFFSYLSWQRCQVWKNGVTLWNDVIEKYPEAAIAYNNRANALLLENQSFLQDPVLVDRVIEDYSKAIEHRPEYANAYFNRALLYGQIGKVDEAIQDYRSLLKFQFKDAVAHYNLANMYSRKQATGLAIGHYSEAIRLNPEHSEAYNNRGHEYSLTGEYQKAMEDYQKALELNPDNELARENLKRVMNRTQ